jgi:hypothetical protein
VNVFHAVQYFGIVAFSEKKNLRPSSSSSFVLVALAIVGLLYGFSLGAMWPAWAPPGVVQNIVLAVVNVVALLHFWYDGFIWSVRRGDV